MEIKELLEIEPRLLDIIKLSIVMNDQAKSEDLYWHNLWSVVKTKIHEIIGFGAENKQINKSEHWDLFHDYIKSICNNLK